jgi:hypothetical protein
MIAILPIVAWGAALVVMALTGFGVGMALGRRIFVSGRMSTLFIYCGAVVACTAGAGFSRALPFRILAGLVQTWFLVAMGVLTVAGLAMFFVFIGDGLAHRRRRQWDPSLCQVCRYCLIGNVSGICPECGARLPTEQRNHLWEEARFRVK